MKSVDIYTDGGCDPNPGMGSWAAILLLPGRPHEIFQAYQYTTNNRMEIMGAVRALEYLGERHVVRLFCDSKYVINGATHWIAGWKKRGWVTRKTRGGKHPVVNRDLWERLDRQLQIHSVTFTWVKGHNGNHWNERADELTLEARRGTIFVDEGARNRAQHSTPEEPPCPSELL